MMSGTSLDGIDAALVEFAPDGDVLHARLLGWRGDPFPDGLRERLAAVLPPATSDVATWARLEAEVGQAYATTAAAAIEELGGSDLISMHGQTLFHWVAEGRALGTLQAGNPSWVAEATGVPVLSDLRSADVAAGGQGAPLASTLDALWLGDTPTAVLNLGGIANVTIVGAGEVVAGDTGPANCLLDAAAERCFGVAYDEDGMLAHNGRVDQRALARLLAEPWFGLPLPKSTGRELFNPDWARARLAGDVPVGVDLMATFAELTARSVADALARCAPVERIVVSGGGARNGHLLGRLAVLTGLPVTSSDELGIPAQAKECVLWALLGWLSIHQLPGVLAAGEGAVTGARVPRVLGSLTPPSPLPPASAPIRRVVVDAD